MSAQLKPGDLRLSEAVGVTTHALEKLRERQHPGSKYEHATDRELRAVLEQIWRQSREANLVELWWEKVDGVLVCNYIVDLSPDIAGDLLGLVREDDRTPGRPCYITCVTAAMAERSRSLNKWARSPEKVGSNGLLGNKLAQQLEQLEGIVPSTEAVAPRPVVQPRPIEKMVVTWVTEGKLRFQAVPKDNVTSFVETLLKDGVDERTIEFWVQAKAHIHRKVAVSFDD